MGGQCKALDKTDGGAHVEVGDGFVVVQDAFCRAQRRTRPALAVACRLCERLASDSKVCLQACRFSLLVDEVDLLDAALHLGKAAREEVVSDIREGDYYLKVSAIPPGHIALVGAQAVWAPWTI